MQKRLWCILLAFWLMLAWGSGAQAQQNGTLVGSPTFAVASSYSTTLNAANFGQAMSLDGSSQYIALPVAGPLDIAAGASFTWECRVRTTTSTGLHVAMGRYSSPSYASLGINAGKGYFSISGIASGAVNSGTTTISDGNWHTLALVVSSGTSCKLYVDGSQEVSATGTAATITSAGTAYIGGWSATSSYWNGQIDEVSISNVAQYTAAYTPATNPFSNSRSGQIDIYHLDGNANDGVTPPAATTYTLSGNLAGIAGQANTLTLTSSGYLASAVTVTISITSGTATLNGGSLTATTVTLAAGNNTSNTFTVQSPSVGNSTLHFTNGTLLTDPGDATYVSVAIIAVTEANWFWSPYNWYSANGPPSYKQTSNTGAYLKVGFNGTSAKLVVDTTVQASNSLSTADYPTLIYTVDNGALQSVQMTSTSTQISLAIGLTSGNHTLQVWVKSYNYNNDRWATPVEAVRVMGLLLDSGAATVAPAGTVALQTKRLLVYGDSITEGLGQENGSDATINYVPALAQALSCEYGQIGFGGQGWGHVGTGNVPTFLTPSNATSTTWDKYFAGQSRLVSGLLSPAPDYIAVVHGTNDSLNSVSDATVQASCQAFLTATRAAAPNAKIFVCVPFGAFKASALAAAVTAQADVKVYLINLGASASAGLTGPQGTTTSQSTDGIHPRSTVHGRLGAMLAQAIQQAINGGGTTTLSLTITKNGSNQPVLTWVADPVATGYKVLRSVDGAAYTVIATVGGSVLTYTDTAEPTGGVTVRYSVISNH